MAVRVQDLAEWLNTLGPEDLVFVDDGGRTLHCVNVGEAYFEIGGAPDESEDDLPLPNATPCGIPDCMLCKALGITSDQRDTSGES